MPELLDRDLLDRLVTDVDPGYLVRWCDAIEDGFRLGGGDLCRLLSAWRSRVRLDFWEAMRDQGGRDQRPYARWPEFAHKTVMDHCRGMAAASGLDDDQAATLMSETERTLAGIMGVSRPRLLKL